MKTVNDIFRNYGPAWREENVGHISREQLKVMYSLEACKTIQLGGHILQCDTCKKQHITYNSCKNRHCPSCQNLKNAAWVLERSRELLPIQYFHVVITLPDDLNPVVFQNQKIMYKLMFDSVAQMLKELSRDPKHLGAHQIGFISTLHTWGQTLMFHPHIHIIVTGGGLSKDKTNWVSCSKDYFINIDVMAMRFRKIFLVKLKKLYAAGELCLMNKIEHLKTKSEFQKLINRLFAKNWVVYSKGNYGDPKNVFAYLSRYTHRVAIGNSRIIKVENDKVYFHYKDNADEEKSKIMALDAKEFIRRFLLHTLPSRFVRVRCYGLLAHRNRNQKLDLCRKLLGVPKEERQIQEIPTDRQELYEMVTGKEAMKCPYCETGHLEYVETIPIPTCPRGP